MTLSSPLTYISFFFILYLIKFANFWYITCCSQFDTNLVPIAWTMRDKAGKKYCQTENVEIKDFK